MNSMLVSSLILTAAIPFLWSACLAAARRAQRSAWSYDLGSEASEWLFLLFMIAPAFVGLALIAAAAFAPPSLVEMPTLGRLRILQTPAMAQTDPARNLNWMWLFARLLLLLYATGAARLLWRFVCARLRLRRIVSGADYTQLNRGRDVGVTNADVPPFASGRTKVILPRNLVARLADEQIELVISHERAHLLRRDPQLFTMLALIEIGFWFNTIIGRQIQRCRLAAELACDAAVTQSRSDIRLAYAETLVSSLKHHIAAFSPAAVVPSATAGDYQVRISEIIQPSGAHERRSMRALFFAALVLSIPTATLQASIASAVPTVGADDRFLSKATMVADQLTTVPGRVTGSGNALLRRDGFEVRAGRITLIDSHRSALPGRFDEMIAEGGAVVRVSGAMRKALIGARLVSDRLTEEGGTVVMSGERVTLELPAAS